MVIANVSQIYELMMDEIAVAPSAGYVGLRLCRPERVSGRLEYFTVEAGDVETFARVRVYAYGPEHLGAFFAELAAEWRGWHGPKSWKSLEGEAKLVAIADGKGHVNIHVRLEPSTYPRPWIFEGNVLVEAGQLEKLAADVRSFVESVGRGPDDRQEAAQRTRAR